MKTNRPDKTPPPPKTRTIRGRWIFLSVLAVCLSGIAISAWLAKGAEPNPFSPGNMGIFVGRFEGFKSPEVLQDEAVSLLKRSLRGTVVERQTDVLLFNKKIPGESLAEEFLEKLNASGMVGVEAIENGARVVFVPRLSGATPSMPRPDLRRLESVLIYPNRIHLPYSPDWRTASALISTHLHLAAGYGSAIPPLIKSRFGPPNPAIEMAEANLAIGTLALSSYIGASSGPDALDQALQYLSAAHEAWPNEQHRNAQLARLNLASALLHRRQGNDIEQAASLLDSVKVDEDKTDISSLRDCLRVEIFLAKPVDAGKATEIAHTLQNLESHWTRNERPYAWAAVRYAQAQLISRSGAGGSIDQAIAAATDALREWTRNPYPGEWASANSLLGTLFTQRAGPDRAENAKMAVDAYEKALQVIRKETMPREWSRNVVALATARLSLTSGKPDEHVRTAIAELEDVLTVVDRDASPDEWAQIQNLMGVAWHQLTPTPERAEKSLEHYRAALEIRQPESHPEQAAKTLANMGNVYRTYPAAGEERRRFLTLSLKAYDAALQTLRSAPDATLAREIIKVRRQAEQLLENLTPATHPGSAPRPAR